MDCLIREFLDLLESKEEKLLSWGIVDGGFSENELEELAEEYLNGCKADEDVWDFLEEMLERRLLFELSLTRISHQFRKKRFQKLPKYR